jgi:threonine dehydrogenase-like Zn-dependent dehydrogenase
MPPAGSHPARRRRRRYLLAVWAPAELLRVPLADGTLVATPDLPADDLISSLLAASDVLGTGWFAAVAAEAGPGKTVAVVVEERGDDGVARIKELTGGLGAHSVVEGVGTQESMLQAIGAARPGGHVGFVGVAHGVELPVEGLFWSLVHLHGGPAPVRRFLP